MPTDAKLQTVDQLHGRVERVPLVPDISTSRIIDGILKRYGR